VRDGGDQPPSNRSRIIMKTDIHPNSSDTTVRCSCGNTFVTKSTVAGDLTVVL
jgi:hypothetical protein